MHKYAISIRFLASSTRKPLTKDLIFQIVEKNSNSAIASNNKTWEVAVGQGHLELLLYCASFPILPTCFSSVPCLFESADTIEILAIR